MATQTLPEGTDQIVEPDAPSESVIETMERTSIPMDNDAEALGMGAAGTEIDGDETPAAGSAGQTFADAKAKAGEKVADLTGQAADRLRAFADTGKGRATESINGLAKLVEDSAQTVDEKIGSQYGDYARQAASMLSGFASKIDEQDVDALLESARDTVRKSPALAIGAAAAIGFVLARVVKSGLDAANDAVDQAAGDKKA